MTDRNYGVCPICGATKIVTKSGVMRDHRGNELDKWSWRKQCAGVGSPPARYVNPDAAAEERGYRQAIADLRDEKAFEVWLDSTAGHLGAVSDPYYRDYFVAFLESRISQDQPGREEE